MKIKISLTIWSLGRNIEAGERVARSVLGRGGLPPLLNHGKNSAVQSARGLAQSKTCRLALAFCFLFSAFCLRTSGQNYSIGWHKISGGGGTSTNGQYSVSGTIGQPDAGGAMSGGSYSLTGGFWSLVSAVQTPGAPALTITHTGNTVKISWPYPSTGWTLQQNNNLALSANWSSSGGVSNDGMNNFITIAPPAGNLFFRLQHP
jgi:hypothetical protein